MLDYADTFNREYSRFIEESYLGRLAAGERILHPPEKLLNMLAFSKEMYEASEGAFNITVGGKLHTLGYGKRTHAAKIWEQPWDDIHFDAHEVATSLGMRLDFGGFGKGWMIDDLAELCSAHGLTSYIINGGGDIRVESDAPVEIALENPNNPAHSVGIVAIEKGSLGSSANNKRTWLHDGRLYRHIVSPDNHPLPDVNGVFVLGSTSKITDSLATIAVLRPDLAPVLEQRYGVEIKII